MAGSHVSMLKAISSWWIDHSNSTQHKKNILKQWQVFYHQFIRSQFLTQSLVPIPPPN
jgi:hypothetical protein